ncbi:MAG: DMT family transporter [Intestinibacter bartlettii]
MSVFFSDERIKGTKYSDFRLLDPVSSVVFSIFLLKEPFSIYQLIGGVIILVSAIIAERNPKPKTIENGEINL